MRALIIGASGATGKELVKTLLKHAEYSQVIIFVRTSIGITHRKLTEILVDFDHLEQVSDYIYGEVWFSCLGTTLKIAGSKERQRHVDYEIPLKFAQIAATNQVAKAVLVSAAGASSESRIFYSRIKGQLEDGLSGLGFSQLFIFRPGALIRKDTDRWTERLMVAVLNFLNGIGILMKFRPISTTTLAEKLSKAPKSKDLGKHVIELDEIFYF